MIKKIYTILALFTALIIGCSEGIQILDTKPIEIKSNFEYEKVAWHVDKYNIDSVLQITGSINPKGVYSFPDTIAGEPVYMIGLSAFSGEQSLTEITLPNSVKVLNNGCFEDTGIKEVNLSNVETILSAAFSGCQELTKVTLGNNLKYIDNYAFLHTAIDSIILPSSVELIGHGCFEWSPLHYIELSTNIKEIQGFAFSANKSLTIRILRGNNNIIKVEHGLFGGFSYKTTPEDHYNKRDITIYYPSELDYPNAELWNLYDINWISY